MSREVVQLQGSLINGIESRLTAVEGKLSDLDARGSKEHDNAANERDLNSRDLHNLITSMSWLQLQLFRALIILD